MDVYAFDVMQQPLAMDVLRMKTLSYNEALLASLAPNTPLQLRWGRGTKMRTFSGYIHAMRPTTDKTSRRIEIIAMSAPMVMLTQHKRVFQNTTASAVITEIVDGHRLQPDVTPTREVADYDQRGRTDWEFVLDLARTVGYVVQHSGVTIQAHPVDDVWTRSKRRQIKASTFSTPLMPGGNLTNFKQDLAGARPAYEYGVDTSLGFLEFARTGTMEGLLTDKLFRDMFPYHAEATLLGLHTAGPLSAFEVANDRSVLTWAALKIHHSYSPEGYETRIDFGGDGTRAPAATAGNVIDISTALLDQALFPQEPLLLNVRPVYRGTPAPDTSARWVAPIITNQVRPVQGVVR